MANGFFGRLGPVLQGAGASLASTGDLTQIGATIPRFQAIQQREQALAGQQQLRDLQTQAAQQRLADAEREREQEAATAEAFRALPPGIFGGGERGAAIRAAGVANPALGQKLLLAQATRKPQRPQVGRFKTDDFGRVIDTTTGDFVSGGATPGQPPGVVQATTGPSGVAPVATAFERQQLGKTLTPGEKAVDQKFAPDVVSFDAGGGFATVRNHLKNLTSVANRLDPRDKAGKPTGDPENLTGFFQGLIANTALENLTPESKEARQLTEAAVVENLKQILGAQFTEKEGARILGLTFDPGLKPRQVGRRVRNLVNQMRTAARQKAAAVRHFKRRGTLREFATGELPNFNFDPSRRTAPRTQQAARRQPGAAQAATSAAPAPAQTGQSFATAEDASANIPEGVVVRDNQTGQFFQKQGDQLVPVQEPNAAGMQFEGQPQLPQGARSDFQFLSPLGGQ